MPTLKLYKRGRGVYRYWEAWPRGTRVIVHEGKLGERGKAMYVDPPTGKTPDQVIAEAAERQRAAGFAEIPREEQYQVVVQYRLQTWGSADDLRRAHEIEDLFNECLGWTGNGRCDGNDIGSGSVNVFSIVVDPRLAARTMVAELEKHGLLDGAVIAANRYGGEYEILYPPDFKGAFELL